MRQKSCCAKTPCDSLRRLGEETEFGDCVATIQGLTNSQYLGRLKNVRGAVGMSNVPLFSGG